jgi:hypothetical protein
MDYNNENSIWAQKDGTVTSIKAMSSTHLINSIKKCQRDKWRISYLPYLLKEAKNRGLDDIYPELFI